MIPPGDVDGADGTDGVTGVDAPADPVPDEPPGPFHSPGTPGMVVPCDALAGCVAGCVYCG